jgi:hypothetical protein
VNGELYRVLKQELLASSAAGADDGDEGGGGFAASNARFNGHIVAVILADDTTVKHGGKTPTRAAERSLIGFFFREAMSPVIPPKGSSSRSLRAVFTLEYRFDSVIAWIRVV